MPVTMVTKRNHTANDVTAMLIDAISRSNMTDAQRDAQKRRYMRDAYRRISPSVIRGIQTKYKHDFVTFGYNDTLEGLEV